MAAKRKWSVNEDQEKYIRANLHKTTNQLAKDLKINPTQLYRWLADKKILTTPPPERSFKKGKDGYFNESEFFRHYAW